jgi:hypothetical protein
VNRNFYHLHTLLVSLGCAPPPSPVVAFLMRGLLCVLQQQGPGGSSLVLDASALLRLLQLLRALGPTSEGQAGSREAAAQLAHFVLSSPQVG